MLSKLYHYKIYLQIITQLHNNSQLQQYKENQIMRFFNQKDADKYEKAMPNLRKPKLNYRKLFIWSLISSCVWLGYQRYKYDKNKQKTQVDVFQWKRKHANSIKWMDLKEKAINFEFKSTAKATNLYEQTLRDRFNEQIVTEMLRISDKQPKKQFILTQHIQHKTNIGFLKLHTFSSYMLIDPNNNIIKRSITTPITIFGVPFKSRTKKTIRASYKKSKTQKFIETKSHFDLGSQCRQINKWNLYALDKKQSRELLFECRNRMEDLNKKLVSQLYQTSAVYFEAERQYDQQEHQNKMSFRTSDDILK